jgi:hypothetical protein
MTEVMGRVDRIEHLVDFFRTARQRRENLGVLTLPEELIAKVRFFGRPGKHHRIRHRPLPINIRNSSIP